MNRVDLTNTFKIFMCCVGAVIGAGFASGQEIISFFINYGELGLAGIILCGFLFFAYVYFALKKIRNKNIITFGGYFADITSKGTAWFIQAVSYGFMFASFCVMVSGSGAVAQQLFGLNTAGIFFMAILCFTVFLKGVDGMVTINAFMTPLIIIGITAVSLYALFGSAEAFAPFNKMTDNFAASALLYVSYNTVTLIGILVPLKDKITSDKVALYSGLLSGGVLTIMGIMLWWAVRIFKSDIADDAVPMLSIAAYAGNCAKYLYGGVLYMAMITTAVSSGFAFITFLKKYLRLNTFILSLAVCGLSIPLAYIGFADLVNSLYRFFGFLGMFVLGLVLLGGLKKG